MSKYIFILIFVIITSLFIKNIENFYEISELDLDKYFNKNLIKSYPNYAIKKDCIFVSIASYRDDECSETVLSLFNNAKNPKNIFIGICSQNDFTMSNEDCIPTNKLSQNLINNNIRINKLKHIEALGPNYARYICSHLWRGEEYYLQIDSHLKFIKNWDTIIKNMYNKLPHDKCVLTHYPPSEEQLDDIHISITCNAHYENDFDIIAGSIIKKNDKNEFYRTPYFSAGLFFTKSVFLYDVPFDPFLPYLFQGEEPLMAARLYTHGYDLYNLIQSIASHNYDRNDKPRFWNDNSHINWNEVQNESKKRYYKIMNFAQDIHPRFNFNIERYGLGNVRSIQDFLNFAGIDHNQKTIISRCDSSFDNITNSWL